MAYDSIGARKHFATTVVQDLWSTGYNQVHLEDGHHSSTFVRMQKYEINNDFFNTNTY